MGDSNDEISLVSVIIPCYNSGEYIYRCLKSISEQSYNKIEIIVLNDGSTDSTLDIINDYEKKDNRIIVINEQTNKGSGFCRNKGINIANGEYIIFVDSDDYIRNDAIEKLVRLANEGLYDVIFYGYDQIEYKSNKTTKHLKIIPTISGHESHDTLLSLYLNQIELCIQAWTYFCRKSFLTKNEIYFDNNIKHFEDIIFSAKLIYHIKALGVINEDLYTYSIRKGSLLTSNNPDKVEERIKAALSVKRFLSEKDELKKNIKHFNFFFVVHAFLMPYLDYVKSGCNSPQSLSFFRDFAKTEIIRTFSEKQIDVPVEYKKRTSKRNKALIAHTKLISGHFNTSYYIIKALYKASLMVKLI